MAKGKTGEPGRSAASVFKAIDDLLRTPGDVSLGKARPLKEEDLAEFEALAGGTRSCASADCTTTPCGRAGARPSPVEQTQQTCVRPTDGNAVRTRGSASLPVEPTQQTCVRPTDGNAVRTRGSASLPVEPTQQACGRDALLRVRPTDGDCFRYEAGTELKLTRYLYFTLFQTLIGEKGNETKYQQVSRDFFDLVIMARYHSIGDARKALGVASVEDLFALCCAIQSRLYAA